MCSRGCVGGPCGAASQGGAAGLLLKADSWKWVEKQQEDEPFTKMTAASHLVTFCS